MNVIEYVTEEVRRQGHDITSQDGLERVAWMLEAWCEAMDRAQDGSKPTLSDVAILGKMIEREKNGRGFRTVGVRVGPHRCPSPERVFELLRMLFDQRDSLTPMEFYKGFENIHPFVDGNGRTGKILLNWTNGTLDAPVFPPADLFGYPIGNP